MRSRTLACAGLGVRVTDVLNRLGHLWNRHAAHPSEPREVHDRRGDLVIGQPVHRESERHVRGPQRLPISLEGTLHPPPVDQRSIPLSELHGAAKCKASAITAVVNFAAHVATGATREEETYTESVP